MGLMSRLSMVFKSKASKALDRAEDPRETLDYSYEKQREMLTQVKRGIADVATSRKRVELQVQQLQQKAGKLQSQARQALDQGREDLAREALSRRQSLGGQLEQLQLQHQQLQAEETKLTQASHRLQAKVDAFRTRKETVKATYTAAEAQTRIGEALSGISEEMSDVGLAIERAENKTLDMQSRAGAIDDLIASGVLDDPTVSADPIQAELDRVGGEATVDVEIERLKSELGSGAGTRELGGDAKQLGAGSQESQP